MWSAKRPGEQNNKSLKRRFVTNLVLIILLNLLIKPIWIFVIDIKVQNTTDYDFGMYGTLLSFSFLLNILLDLGITNYNNRNISQNHQLLRKYFSNIVVLKFLLAGVYAIIVFGIAGILGYDSQRIHILIFLVLNQFLTSFTLYLRSNIAGMQMHTTNSLVSVLDRSLMILFCAVLIWGGVSDQAFKIEWFVYAQTAAYLLTTLICFVIVLRKSKFPRFRFDRLFFLVVLRQSYPFALLVLLMSIYTRIDMVILDYLMGEDGERQASIYIHGFRIFDAAYQFALLFAVLLLPIFSKMLGDRQNIHELTRLSSLLLFIPSIALAVGAWYYRHEIMGALYDENIALSANPFGVIMFAFLGMAGSIIYGTLLTANGSLKVLNITSAIAVAINLILNLILIPHFYVMGAAISALMTQGFIGISQYIIAARLFRFGLNPSLIFRVLVYIAGVFALALGSKQLQIDWWIGFVGVIISAVILAMALSVIDLRDLLRLIRDGEDAQPSGSK